MPSFLFSSPVLPLSVTTRSFNHLGVVTAKFSTPFQARGFAIAAQVNTNQVLSCRIFGASVRLIISLAPSLQA